jgi:hypothetical protein
LTASGFYLNNGAHIFLVTARHVLFDESKPNRPLACREAELLSYSRDPKDTRRNILQLDLTALNTLGAIKAHSTHDVAVIRVGSVSPTAAEPRAQQGRMFGPSSGVKVVESSSLLGVNIGSVTAFDDVLTANEIYVLGYPSSIGIPQIPQVDYLKPLLRKGIVAGINRQAKTIILDCLVYQGNSGGPVLEADVTGLGATAYHVIGVISQFIPVAETWVNQTLKYANAQVYNSGYAVAVPMDMVLELVK